MAEPLEKALPLVSKRIGQYIMLRDQLKKIDERRTKVVEAQAMVQGEIQSFLDQNGLDTIKSEYGTAYVSTRYSAALSDPEAFMNYVKDNQAWELLDRRANVTAVRAYVEEKGNLPPGANLSAVRTVGVRRPGNGN